MIYCRSSFFLIALFFSEIGMQKGQIHVKFRRFLKLRNLTRILKAYIRAVINLWLTCCGFLGYEPFCEAIRNLFGNDVSTQDLKALFRKIALNPDAQVDWSEVSCINNLVI